VLLTARLKETPGRNDLKLGMIPDSSPRHLCPSLVISGSKGLGSGFRVRVKDVEDGVEVYGVYGYGREGVGADLCLAIVHIPSIVCSYFCFVTFSAQYFNVYLYFFTFKGSTVLVLFTQVHC